MRVWRCASIERGLIGGRAELQHCRDSLCCCTALCCVGAVDLCAVFGCVGAVWVLEIWRCTARTTLCCPHSHHFNRAVTMPGSCSIKTHACCTAALAEHLWAVYPHCRAVFAVHFAVYLPAAPLRAVNPQCRALFAVHLLAVPFAGIEPRARHRALHVVPERLLCPGFACITLRTK